MKDKLIKLTIGIILFLGIIIFQNKVEAVSISISASSSSIKENGSVTINVSSDGTERINLSTSNGSLSSNSIWVEGNTKSVTLKGVKAGKATITAVPVTLSNSNGEDDNNVASKSCTISVVNSSSDTNSGNAQTQTQTKSSVATLANLGIKPNDFSGFSPNKTTYSTTVPNSTTSIEIYAQKGQSGQKITGTGKKQLKEGNNAFSVKVTAEDGKTTKTYNLTVTRKASENANEENTTNNITAEETKQENQTGLSQLSIEGITLSPEFKNDIYEYTANISDDKEKLDITATPITENDKVEITGNENLKDGENVITILVSDESGENTVTYQINVKKGANNNEIINKNNEKKSEILIISIIGAAIIIIIIAIIVHHAHAKNNIYNGMYMPFEEGVSEQEKIEKEEEIHKKRPEKKRKSKGKRFK